MTEDAGQKTRKVGDLVTYFENISNELNSGKTRATLEQFKRSVVQSNKNDNLRTFPSNLNKCDKIIEELLKTEETYFQTLRHIIGDYIFYFKIELDENIFQHLEELGRHQVMFYGDLLEANGDSEEIGRCFLKHKQLFYCYKTYIKDMHALFDIVSNKYKKKVEARSKQLGDKFRLADQLLTPFQRLTRYILLLRNILKERNKSSNQILKEAITYLESIAAELNLNG